MNDPNPDVLEVYTSPAGSGWGIPELIEIHDRMRVLEWNR